MKKHVINNLQAKYIKRREKLDKRRRKAKEGWFAIDINAYTNKSEPARGKFIKGMCQSRLKVGKMVGGT